jgi:hypothetical protein
MHDEFEVVIQEVDVLAAELARFSSVGPHFVIAHRFWQPNTTCTNGEAIGNVELAHRARRFLVSLSTSLLLLFDYLARHRHTGQSASQIAAGLSADPFCQEHGAYAGAHGFLSKNLSRTAVKQQIIRLRAALASAFREARLGIDVNRVLTSEETDGNEVRYRLRASIDFEHFEC